MIKDVIICEMVPIQQRFATHLIAGKGLTHQETELFAAKPVLVEQSLILILIVFEKR